MTTTIANYSVQSGIRTVGGSVGEVLSSFKNLFAGIWVASTTKSQVVAAPLTAFEEAEVMRAYAEQFISSDADYAQDLFMQADRHERAAASTASAR
jgi:hypothetical protein